MKIEIFRRRGLLGKKWYFRLIARNGEIVASSESYHNLKDAQDTVGNIMIQAGFATVNVLT